ncbi:GTP-binding protein [Paucidesulfovibrio gracilis DSM 16080]|uniref:GTPase Der n=1 Tax=Paucidesulfovibrio gracilis DSM 16080 TaxID=1121449 RepID=A0A1T4XAY0_9BACT|nr:ribosome biogenesis GTPase Der [Paucidesulfovibrio gracilis]SKA86653.1 GTP-binding protein [Paucidesulfovibrio gracilis DSM 16080]
MPATFALIGRPNVGKSTLFNRLLRRSLAITHDTPGVTRDRIYGEGLMRGVPFALIDTGGMVLGLESDPGQGVTGQGFEAEIVQQAQEGMAESQAVLMVVDGRAGLTHLDEEAARLARQSGKPVLLIVNKVDGAELEDQAQVEFHGLGFEMLSVSASHGFNLQTLRDRVADMAQEYAPDEPPSDVEQGLRIALLGRPNAGKSSTINALIGQDRLIVSDVAGTTRDSVDVTFERGNKRYTFVDTAGVRRRTNIVERLERFTVVRALKSSKKADVTVMVVDAIEGLTRQDKRLLEFLVKEKTPFLVTVNKTDLVPSGALSDLKKAFAFELRFAPHVPVLYTSALRKKGLNKVLPLAGQIHKECATRVGTGVLNRSMTEALERHQPPVVKRRRPKFYYLTQADADVPTFVFFMNDHTLLKDAYRRYLENQLRKMFGIQYAPMHLVFRSTHEKKVKELKRGISALGKVGPGRKVPGGEEESAEGVSARKSGRAVAKTEWRQKKRRRGGSR